jgi:hypothetical protein
MDPNRDGRRVKKGAKYEKIDPSPRPVLLGTVEEVRTTIWTTLGEVV